MINLKFYTEANDMQRHDAQVLLEEYGDKMKWKSHGDRTIDVGTGDGGVLMDIIRKYIPDNYEVIVGCDVNEENVLYANKRYSEEKIKFVVLNIEGEIPGILQASFDHVFSFYVMHWIKDQRRAFQNMYNLLQGDGDMLVMLVGYMSLFELFRQVSKIEKWSKYVGDVNKYISPYHDSKNPEIEIKKIMELSGFTNVKIGCKKKCYEFKNIEFMKKSFLSINPFIVPEEMHEEFLEDMTHMYLKIINNKSEVEHENGFEYFVNYNLITVYGIK